MKIWIVTSILAVVSCNLVKEQILVFRESKHVPELDATTSKTIQVKKNDLFAINLETNPSTGYQWNFKIVTGQDVVKSSGTLFAGENTYTPKGIFGAPVRRVDTLKAMRKGNAKLEFRYTRFDNTTRNVYKVLVKVE